jgi:hypothetical protein
MASRGNPPAKSRMEAGSRATIPRGGKTRTRERASRAQEKPSRAIHSANRALTARRGELCPRRQLSQRERERERRVSDADASYNGPARSTRTLNCVIPQANHANYISISVATRSLSTVPSKALAIDHEDRPKPSLMLCPAPTRMPRQSRQYTTAALLSRPRRKDSQRSGAEASRGAAQGLHAQRRRATGPRATRGQPGPGAIRSGSSPPRRGRGDGLR